jgi:hypothetical protein
VLQHNSNPADPGGWQSWGYAITDDGASKSVALPSAAGKWFFRLAQRPALPGMTIRRLGNSVVVSWPSSATGFLLEENSDFTNAGGWCSSSLPVTDDGTTRSVTLNSPAGRLFFRLAGD